MVLTILVITGFQFYWLRQNYMREKNALQVRSQISFQETVQELQGNKLRLWEPAGDSLTGDVKIFVSDTKGPVKVTRTIRNNAISRINVIRDKMLDTIQKGKKGGHAGMIISLDETRMRVSPDSQKFVRKIVPGTEPDQIFRLLYGVDSLQDTLRVSEIDTAFRAALDKEKLNVPFTIKRLDSTQTLTDEGLNDIRVGFVNPVTYRLSLGNTMGYLMKQISMPILFSLVLLGITLLSFISLYRNAVRQQRLAALKNEFISNITHELKTPIATVGVAIEALKNFNAIQDPQRTREYLDISTNELHRLSLLVDKVLKLSMFEKEGVELKYEPLNLKDLTEEVLGSLKLQLEKKHANVSTSYEGDLNLRGDRHHLLSVIFNLVDNALKYSQADPKIFVTISGSDDSVQFDISDNGIGIDPAYKDKIFEKFFRVPHGDTHNAKGHGLGLSYTAQVIQKHNGTIKCESQPGNGTKFTIILPKDKV